MTARLLLVRHGETVWHAENRYAGTSDVELTPRGIQQARDLGRWVMGESVDAITTSPLRRARETAEPAARALGLEPRVREGLREMDFGWAEGRTRAELSTEDPEAVRKFLADAEAGAPPDSEPPAEVARRVVGALLELALEYEGGTVLVVAHNTALRVALCSLLGIPLGRYRLVLPRLENAAVTGIDLSGRSGQAALRFLNVPTTAKE
jgi:broad specificity phosphatase PhoE